MSEIAVHLPVNGVSFGQVSVGLLREMHKRGTSPCIFPVNPTSIDLGTQRVEGDFKKWLEDNINKSLRTHKRSEPIFKLWHLNGSLESYSDKQVLFTFYELDQPTQQEINIARNQHKVIVSSEYSKSILENSGLNNVSYVPLFFDKESFKKKDKNYFTDDRVTFNLTGKFEKRKHHQKIIRAWAKKFGNNKRFSLQCATYNSFLKEEDNQNIINSILEGKAYDNISFLGYMSKNDLYNDFLNSGDVILACSGGEGWGLPEFHSVAMGKHAVTLNAHAYKGWADESNSTFINPTGKTEVYDGMFFQKGQPYNQGSIFDFDDEEFITACEQVIEKVGESRVNKAGLLLQEKFTVEKTLDGILEQF